MANNNVIVTLAEGHEVILNTDAPDIGSLVGEIVKIKDSICLDDITIECDFDGFDKASFKEVIVEATNSFLKSIELEKAKYDAILNTLRQQDQ
jgi:hypothetical protein